MDHTRIEHAAGILREALDGAIGEFEIRKGPGHEHYQVIFAEGGGQRTFDVSEAILEGIVDGNTVNLRTLKDGLLAMRISPASTASMGAFASRIVPEMPSVKILSAK